MDYSKVCCWEICRLQSRVWFQTLFGEYKDPQCALWTVFCNDSISEVATAPCLLWIVCFRRGLEVGYTSI